eukprot:3472269-Rhodomonas_salina.2
MSWPAQASSHRLFRSARQFLTRTCDSTLIDHDAIFGKKKVAGLGVRGLEACAAKSNTGSQIRGTKWTGKACVCL